MSIIVCEVSRIVFTQMLLVRVCGSTGIAAICIPAILPLHSISVAVAED